MVKLQRVLLKIKNLAVISLGDARVSDRLPCSKSRNEIYVMQT